MSLSIFEEQISRKPDFHPWTQDFIEAMHNGFWTHKEFTFSSDLQDFKVKLSEKEQQIIVRSLSCIGQLEISVKKFWANLGNNLPHPSINDMGYVMANQEVIHGDAYERLLEILGLETAFDDLLKHPVVSGRVNYLKKYLVKFHSNNRKQFLYSIILFSIFVENIALFSQFYTISWFGKFKNVLKDTNKQVDYTSREEDLHAKIGIKLVNIIRKELPELFDEELIGRINEETVKAVEYECKIIDWILDGYHAENLNSDLLKVFIKNRLNESLAQMNFSKIFDLEDSMLKKTFWFDEQILGNSMQDFFHSRPTEYSKKSQSFSENDLF